MFRFGADDEAVAGHGHDWRQMNMHMSASKRSRIRSSLRSAGQPYAAATAASSFLCERWSHAGRSL